ncbi:MAG: L-seryl-tRNA(Sec) selenium transferase [Actinobacteria bacterium]|nr:L-seryl-tRNA(Sec) selenium transferase [Actinomycetota bacterium]
MSLGSGSDAGRGRKRNAARIVVTTPIGTAIDDTRATPKVRNRPRIRARAWQPRRLTPVRPPSVDALARELAVTGLPHPLLVDVARAAIDAGAPESAAARAADLARALLQPVVNATGVLLHTNLGRAPVDVSVPARFTNLEFDLTTGRRGSRHGHAATLLARAAGAEAALVVNNGAAAVMLVLAALARDRDVAVSRGELVEIGGGFRVPEVMAQSGARLREVGTTNRTRLADYAAADADVVLKVHQSNYRIVGFTEAVDVRQLATLGRPVVVDQGSGLLDAATPWLADGPPAWLRGEPAVKQTLAAGADLVTCSGDKLLGGPQAGVIFGRRDLVDRCGRHPLARALRPGQLVLAALQETAMAYLRRDGDAIPFWRMATVPAAELRRRAAALGVGEVIDTVAVAGAGSLPGFEIPSAGIALDGDHSEGLRMADPPVIGRVHQSRTVLDLRTVDPADDPLVAKAAAACMS